MSEIGDGGGANNRITVWRRAFERPKEPAKSAVKDLQVEKYCEKRIQIKYETWDGV